MKYPKIILPFVSALCLMQPVYADYSGEFGLTYGKIKDSPSNDKVTLTNLGVTLYFENINTSDGPLAEAAFLNPTSNINFSLDQQKLDAATYSGKWKQTLFGFAAVNSDRNIEFKVNVGNTKYSSTSWSSSPKSKDTLFGLNLYASKGQSFGITREKNGYDDTVTGDKSTSDRIFYRQLFALDAGNYVSVELGHEKTVDTYKAGYGSDETTKFDDIQTSYYINRETGILFNYGKFKSNDANGANGKLMMLGLGSYITPDTELGLAYVKYTGDSATEEDSKGFALTLASRF